ncbi:MAG: hypothetical protein IT393_03385 [Nitrospirae bacterium]|nr:hypothetical protein [Nitrospirota bacterium]
MKFTGFNSILIILSPLLALSLFINGCAVTGDEDTLLKVSPESVVVTFGGSKSFSVSPAGTTVTWSVDGILNGNEGTVGTIESDGTYTAPAGAVSAPEKVIVRAEDANGIKGSAVAFLTTFKSNKRLTTHYTAGISRANTYSSGQKNIAVFKESGTGDVNVYAVWSDKSSGQYKVYLSRSGDGGVSFDDPVPVDNTSTGEQFSPAIAADGNGDVFIVWEDHGQGDADIFLRKYISATGVFESKKQINPDTTGPTDYDTTPSIDVSADEIYITWEHRENSGDNYPEIYYAWSSNLGDTFPVKSSLSVSGRRPAVAMDPSGTAYVAWEYLGELIQFPSVPTHIRLRKISGGTPATSLDLDVVSGFNARFPSIAVDPVCPTSCKVYIAWQRAMISEQKFVGEITTSYDIDLAIVDGATMTSPGYTLSVTDSGSSGFVGGWAYPAIAVDNSYIYLVWDDWRNGVKDIYFARSSNGTDFTTNRIVNDDINNSSLVAWHEKPGIAVADGKAHVIWTDYRNTQSSTTVSPNDVFFAVEQ